MMTVVCSRGDPVAASVAKLLVSLDRFEAHEPINGNPCLQSERLRLLEIQDRHIDADWISECLDADLVVFPSSHFSSSGVGSFTTHAEGNWSDIAKFGGRPKALSVAAPRSMLKILRFLEKNSGGIGVSYEATHHGPFLDIPSLFVEVGGDNEIKSEKNIRIVADSVMALVNDDEDAVFESVAIGIGGGHYPGRFTKLALSGKYAFSHIMSKHYAGNVDMLEQAFSRSIPKAEVAVVEWKGIKSGERQKVMTRLDELGIRYVKV
jgi:D-aminoacyl-tRNA deacylase